MNFIDSHCHLHDSRIIDDMPGIAARAEAAGVKAMVTCATMEENFEQTARLSLTYPSILPCFGIHPWFLDSLSLDWKKNLEQYLVSYPSGIGETGLDFMIKTLDRDRQTAVFEHHLMLAREMERPINIHIRKAWDAFVRIIKKLGKFKTPGLIHSYSGSADLIPIFEAHNLYISFSGSVTQPGAKKVVKALKAVSRKRFVLETDTPDIYPYLPEPEAHRLNEPRNLAAIARIASERVGFEFETFSAQAYQNSLDLFSPLLERKKAGK
jgi:TatD DNase family protein